MKAVEKATDMETVRLCRECAAPLPVDAPEGLCPKCLVKAGLGMEPAAKSGGDGFVPPDPKELARSFPQLEIIELLGQGGMGVVYKARQPQLDRLVALKILPPASGRDPAFAERFTREARALARLSHPNIVAIHDFGRAGDYFYLVMEFVDGVNLRQLEQSRRLAPQEALVIIPKICEALQYAHEEGIVHRDIKPGNILIDKKGRVKIADFGLAKLLGKEATGVGLTQSKQVMGTLHYMAPEQMNNPQSVDHRADIYSLGVVFYEMLTGQLPVGRFAPPSQSVQLDVRLDEVVLKSLEREPERRYQHASDVKTEVERIGSAGATLPSEALNPLKLVWTDWWSRLDQTSAKAVKTLLLAVYLVCLFLFFSYRGSGSRQGFRHEVGYPTSWFVVEKHQTELGGGHSWGVHFLSPSWLILAVGALAYYVFARIAKIDGTFKQREHRVCTVWLPSIMAVVAIGVSLVPLILELRKTTTSTLGNEAAGRESPVAKSASSTDADAGSGALIREQKTENSRGNTRLHSYYIEAPANRRVSFWIDCWRNGQPAPIHGLDLADSFIPAQGESFAATVELEFFDHRPGTNMTSWLWRLKSPNGTISREGRMSDPFLGMSLRDSTEGRMPLRKPKPDETITLLTLRGAYRELPGDSITNPAGARKADRVIELKVRIDPVQPAGVSTDQAVAPLAAEIQTTKRLAEKGIYIREQKHVSNTTWDGRFYTYDVSTPANHRVSFWLECWRDGQRVILPDFDFANSVTPARGKPVTGFVGLAMWESPDGAGTNKTTWTWGLNLDAGLFSKSGSLDNPFADLPYRDSTWGRVSTWNPQPGEELTLLMIRGDKERLSSGRTNAQPSDLLLKLKARVDAVPESAMQESPQSSSTIPLVNPQ